MNHQAQVERLFEALIDGDRIAARRIVDNAMNSGLAAREMISELYWPTHELIEKLHRGDQITTIAYQLSTRLLRVLADQAAALLDMPEKRTAQVFVACGPSQGEELAAQMATDLLECDGYHVTFTGGGIPADEIISQVQERSPEVLLMFGSAASDLPGIRQVIDTLREIAACPNTRIIVGGGVFARAEGLAEEIGADGFAENPMELHEVLSDAITTGVAERRAELAAEREMDRAQVRKRRRHAA